MSQSDEGEALGLPTASGVVPIVTSTILHAVSRRHAHVPTFSKKHFNTRNVGSSSRKKQSSRPSKSDIEIFKRLSEVPFEAWQLPNELSCGYCGAVKFYGESPGFCCGSGKIELPLPKMPLELWDLYVNDLTPVGFKFRRRCRTYNNSMAFTSIRMTYDIACANKGVYTFKVQGTVKHYIRELIPQDGVARHLQLYFYGTENEQDNHLSQSGGLDATLFKSLVQLLGVNPYHIFFTNVREIPSLDSYAIRLRADPELDTRVYSLPVVEHVAAIWNEGIGPSLEKLRDIIVNLKSSGVSWVHYYYGCYDPLQYVLLFPYGEPGWHAGMTKKKATIDLIQDEGENEDEEITTSINPSSHQEAGDLLAAEHRNLCKNVGKGSRIAMREYYCYLLQIRHDDDTSILRTGCLVQQFQVDMYVKIETQRLDFLRHNQSSLEIRAESYQRIVESMTVDGVTTASDIGQRVILPPSFTGGPRDLRRRYMNALALVARYGRPDFFHYHDFQS